MGSAQCSCPQQLIATYSVSPSVHLQGHLFLVCVYETTCTSMSVTPKACFTQEHASTLDGIIDTVSAKHPLPDYLNLLKLNGRLAIVGVPPEPLELPSGSLVFQRRLIGGSLIGGIRETQEMLVRSACPLGLLCCCVVHNNVTVSARLLLCLGRPLLAEAPTLAELRASSSYESCPQ